MRLRCIRCNGMARSVQVRMAIASLFFLAVANAGISVKLEGNAFLKSHKIKEVLSPEPESYSKDGILTWQEDAQFYASDLYRRNGFFDIKVDVDIHLHPGGGKQDWDAVLKITEGTQYAYDSVRVVVVPDTSKVDTVKVAPPQQAPQTALVVDTAELAAKRGKPYEEDLIFEDRRLLLQRYGNSGYVRVKVDDKVTVKADTKTVKVDYLVEPSYPVLFDTLIIRNQRAAPADSLEGITRDLLLRSLVKYHKGDTVRLSNNDRLIEKLQYTGDFNFIRIKDSLMPDHGSALILQMEERMPGNIRTSFFYDTYSGFGVSVDARHNNFAGNLNEVRGGLALATLRQTLYAGYGSPLIRGYLIRFDNDFSINWYQTSAVSSSHLQSTGGLFSGDFQAINSTRLTWPWSYWLRLVGDAELESKSRMKIANSRERSLNLNFIQTAYFSFLNQALDPSRGIRFAPTWGNGGPFIEDNRFRFTELRYNWFELQTGYYYYLPDVKQAKVALRVDGGRFLSRGGTNSDRFFLGGSRSIRSYGFRELCPETETDTVATRIAGHPVTVCSTQNQTLAYFLTSYELRFALFGFGHISSHNPLRHLVPLELVPFYDFGKVWNVEKGFHLSGGSAPPQRGEGTAYGLGFRYPLLGIFNFRLDIAYGRHRNTKWPDAIIVDLAQAF